MDNEDEDATARISISDSSDESDYYDVPEDTVARTRLKLRQEMSRLAVQGIKGIGPALTRTQRFTAYLAQKRLERNQLPSSNDPSFGEGPSTSSTSISWSDNRGFEHTTTPNFEILKALRLANMKLAQAHRRRESVINDLYCPLRDGSTTCNPAHSVSLQSVIINPRANNDGEPLAKVRKLLRHHNRNIPSCDADLNNSAPILSNADTDVTIDEGTPTTAGTSATQRSTSSNITVSSEQSENVYENEVDGVEGVKEDEGINGKKENIPDIAKIEDTQLNQALLTLLECPVCLECMEPPMAQCRRGHLICHTCRGRMMRCPVCRASFTSVRNRAMEQVAEKLRYPCRHGCGAVIALRLRVRHEASCVYRRYGCPLPMCTVVAMPRDALINHFLDKHPDMVAFGSKGTFRYCRTVNQHDWIMAAHNQIFHVQFCTTNRNIGVSGSVTYVGPKKDARKFTYEISLVGNECSRKLVYSRETHSDLDCRTEYYSQGDAFFVPFDNTVSFVKPSRNNNTLAFNVEVQPNKNVEDADESA